MKYLVLFFTVVWLATCRTPARQQVTGKLSPEEAAESFASQCNDSEESKAFYKNITSEGNCRETYLQLSGAYQEVQAAQERKREADLDTSLNLTEEKPNDNGNLFLYDSCKEAWFDTGLPYRANPTYFTMGDAIPDYDGSKYTVNGEKLQLKYLNIYEIDKLIKPGGGNIPSSLRGIWWMDGNPMPEVVLSTFRGRYDRESKLFFLHYNAPETYMFLPVKSARVQYSVTNALRTEMVVDFSNVDPDNPKKGDLLYIYSKIALFGILKNKKMPTTYVTEGHWKRESFSNCYNLRRLVDERGKKLPVYDYFIQVTQKELADYKVKEDNILMFPKYLGPE